MSPDTRGPHVSIILPACTSADGLPTAIESILNQTYPDFELIIVKDRSADSTREVLARWNDPRVVIISNPGKCGVSRACNTGIGAARGELIGFISSGDEWDRKKLEEQVAAFSRLPGEYGVVYSDVWEVTPAGTRAYWHSPDMTGPELLNSYATDFQAATLGIGPLLVQRSFLDRAGPFDEQLPYFSDTDMIIRLQRLCRFYAVQKPLYCSRSRQALAASPFKRSISQLLLMEKYPETLENQVFLTHQLNVIRRNLCGAREGCPVITGLVTRAECGQIREPVPDL